MGIRLQRVKRPALGSPVAPPRPRTYVVVSGDTLWGIAERFYGDGSEQQRIAEASGLIDVDLVHPGQILTLP